MIIKRDSAATRAQRSAHEAGRRKYKSMRRSLRTRVTSSLPLQDKIMQGAQNMNFTHVSVSLMQSKVPVLQEPDMLLEGGGGGIKSKLLNFCEQQSRLRRKGNRILETIPVIIVIPVPVYCVLSLRNREGESLRIRPLMNYVRFSCTCIDTSYVVHTS